LGARLVGWNPTRKSRDHAKRCDVDAATGRGHHLAMAEGLIRRDLPLAWSGHRAMAEAGGLWAIPHWLSRWELLRRRAELLAEARERGVRALEDDTVDEALVEALPDLEFLRVAGIAEGRLIERLTGLRLLGLSAWNGPLDLGRLARLEWLAVGEPEPGDLDSLLPGHPTLRHLRLGRYADVDLAGLERLRLAHLWLGNSRRLASLQGIAALAPTLTGLELWRLPALRSLDGIDALTNLESLVLSSLRSVTTLEWVASLPNLRLLDVLELKSIESLAPLAGHGSLEYLAIPRTRDLDLEPLRSLPKLRVVLAAPGRWRGDGEDLRQLSSRPRDDPEMRRMWRLREG
jgi:hypothetical protein